MIFCVRHYLNKFSNLFLCRFSFRKSEEGPETKRIKIEEEAEDDDDDDEDANDVKKNESAVDITEKFILERINPGLAADLVNMFSPVILSLRSRLNR